MKGYAQLTVSSTRNQKILWLYSILGASVWTALFLLPRTVFEGIDFVRFIEPYESFFRTSILRGEFPWWNPYASLGRPFAADVQSCCFYPPTWLIIPFGLRYGWVLATVLHGILALVGCQLLARILFGSVSWGLGFGAAFLASGTLVERMQAGQTNFVNPLCYIPLIFYLGAAISEKANSRHWGLLSFAIGLQLLSGHPQVSWITLLGLGLFVLGRGQFCLRCFQPFWSLLLWLVSALVFGLALAGVVLVPFFELVKQSNRISPSINFSAAFAMTPPLWLSLGVPKSRVFPILVEYNAFVTLLVLVAGITGFVFSPKRIVRGLMLMALVGTLIALGNTTPMFAAFYYILPGLSGFRIPARAAILVSFALQLSALAFFTNPPISSRARAFLLCTTTVVAFAVLTAWIHVLAPNAIGWFVWQIVFIVAGAIALCGFTFGNHKLKKISAICCVSILVVETAFSYAGIKSGSVFTSIFPAEAAVVSALTRLPPSIAPVRVSVGSSYVRENAGMIYGFAGIAGYESLSLNRVWRYLHATAGVNADHPFNTIPDGRVFATAPLQHALNISAFMAPDESYLQLDPAPDPRIYLTGSASFVADSNEAIEKMVKQFPIHDTTLIESSYKQYIDLSDPPRDAKYRARIEKFSLNRIEIDIESSSPAILVLSEAWYPGWELILNGKSNPCFPVNAWMRGVQVPAGHWKANMEFHSPGFFPGLLCSLGALVVIILAIAKSPKRSDIGNGQHGNEQR